MTLLISTGNAMAVVGQSYRWVRDRAPHLGVAVLRDGKKSFVEAEAFLSALKAKNAQPAPDDPELAMRQRVFGNRRRP